MRYCKTAAINAMLMNLAPKLNDSSDFPEIIIENNLKNLIFGLNFCLPLPVLSEKVRKNNAVNAILVNLAPKSSGEFWEIFSAKQSEEFDFLSSKNFCFLFYK